MAEDGCRFLASEALVPDEADSILADFHAAKAQLELQLSLKLDFYRHLPHLLICLAHTDPDIVCRTAAEALKQFDAGEPALQHRLSLLFCAAFRVCMEQLARGAKLDNISGLEGDLFRLWVARFAFIPIVERSVEGKHAMIAVAPRRSPNISPPLVSLTLRLPWLLDQLHKDPSLFTTLVQDFARFRVDSQVVSMFELGSHPSLAGCEFKGAQNHTAVVSVFYRCDLTKFKRKAAGLKAIDEGRRKFRRVAQMVAKQHRGVVRPPTSVGL
jgi:hypothetical protein